MPDDITPQDTLDFAHMLKGLGSGSFNDDATSELIDLVKTMRANAASLGGAKQKGKLKVEIALTLENGLMIVDPKMSVTTPTIARQITIMYPTLDGRLSKQPDNGAQQRLALSSAKDVSTPDLRAVRNTP